MKVVFPNVDVFCGFFGHVILLKQRCHSICAHREINCDPCLVILFLVVPFSSQDLSPRKRTTVIPIISTLRVTMEKLAVVISTFPTFIFPAREEISPFFDHWLLETASQLASYLVADKKMSDAVDLALYHQVLPYLTALLWGRFS